MNELFVIKYDDLLTEFNRYVIEHPEFLEQIPNEALVVFIDHADPEFSRYNLERAVKYRQYDDLPGRPVVYLDVGELAPVHSRLLNPRILPQTPDLTPA